jgi:ATP-dependent Clp protease ATP-binding subunit ClpA
MTPPPSLQDLINTVHQDAPSGGALDQLVTAAATVAELEDTSDALLGHFVDRCRREGRSWSEISGALGVTKQAVHKRFAASWADKIIAANPSPTLERFTDRARKALAAASRIAQEQGVQQASSAHLLLGLFTQPEGIAAKALEEMNVSRDAVEAAIRAAAIQAGKPAPTGTFSHETSTWGDSSTQADRGTETDSDTEPGTPPARRLTADGRRALRDALAVALEHGHNYIGTEHLLLALYRDPGSPAAVILTASGATERKATARVTELLRGFGAP